MRNKVSGEFIYILQLHLQSLGASREEARKYSVNKHLLIALKKVIKERAEPTYKYTDPLISLYV